MTLEARPDLVTTRDGSGAVGTVEAPRRGRWIDVWDPEDAGFWAGKGRAVARRNLWPSIFAEFLGFSVWQLWSIVVVSMPGAGFSYSTDQLFWLVALPSLVGATLRLPYTFAVPRFGGRNWTVVSATAVSRTVVCGYDVLLPERGVAALIGDVQIALFRTHDGSVFALGNHDPISGANVMSRGIVGSRGDVPTVASPMFKQAFDLRTGACLDDPSVSLPVYRVEVVDGHVVVDFGDD